MERKTRGAATFPLILSGCIIGISAIFLRQVLKTSPPSDFSDIYLAGLTALAYRYPWKLAAIIGVLTLAVSVYVLAPLDFAAWVEIGSYTVSATLCLWIMARLRRRTS